VRGVDYMNSVEKVDDHTVTFHYNSIYPGYLTQLGGEQLAIWPAHYCNPKQGFAAWDCARQPISTGPFVLDEWSAGEQMVFSRNEKYFEPGKPFIDKITIKIVPDDAVMKQMMMNGDADIFMWVSETIAEEFQKSENVKVSVSPTNRWVLRLWPNRAVRGEINPETKPHPIFADVAVRQAMRMAIDVDTIAKTAFRGYSAPTWTEFHRDPYKCEIPRPEYDLEKAKSMLETAGWKDTDGDGVRECHGCKNAEEGYVMKAELATYPDYGEPMILAQQLVAEMLKKVGMQLSLVTIEGNVMWSDAASGGTEQSGNFDVDLWDDGYSGVDPTDYLSEVYTSDAAKPGNGMNVVRFMNSEVDALIEQAYTLDEAKRKDVFCQLAKIFDQELPNIPLTTIINADAYDARLQNIISNGNDVVSWNAADWMVVK
jgi:peptide/nickel transport system substrate-binding protein